MPGVFLLTLLIIRPHLERTTSRQTGLSEWMKLRLPPQTVGLRRANSIIDVDIKKQNRGYKEYPQFCGVLYLLAAFI